MISSVVADLALAPLAMVAMAVGSVAGTVRLVQAQPALVRTILRGGHAGGLVAFGAMVDAEHLRSA